MLTDAHCHPQANQEGDVVSCFAAATRSDWEILDAFPVSDRMTICYGIHPWYAQDVDFSLLARELDDSLRNHPNALVGEIGLDRLRSRLTGEAQNKLFCGQLKIAARYHRPVVLHGAKCWGEVVKGCNRFQKDIPAFLFHGFSRSDGLLPDIASLNGFISVGSSVLNEHAVNYHKLVAKIPLNELLLETDSLESTQSREQELLAIAQRISVLRKVSPDEIIAQTAANFNRFKKGEWLS